MKASKGRYQILQDGLFWTKLAYHACGWLRNAEDVSLRRFWIDDFLPEIANDTQRGVDVEGIAWIGEGSRTMHPYRFVASIPQKLLHRQLSYTFECFTLDASQRTLQLEIARKT